MQFSDVTNSVKTRNEKVLNVYPDWEKDHTAVSLQVGKFPVNQIFYKDPHSDNIIIEFDYEIHNKIPYSRYEDFKRDYVSALSFINGALVKIRKEFTGNYSSKKLGKKTIESEVEISYSFNTLKTIRQSKYLPVGDPLRKGRGILNHFFLNNFQKFQEWNKILDFNTIIFFLSTAQETNTIEGKFFIQIIAFEKISSLYADHLGEGPHFNPTQEIFAPIRNELLQVLEKYKSDFGKSYLNAKSTIGNLHQVKGLSTKPKMFRILQDFDIPIGEKTEDIINFVRNRAIHRGTIADEWKDSYIYWSLLDEIIRELILRIIGYEGERNKHYIGK